MKLKSGHLLTSAQCFGIISVKFVSKQAKLDHYGSVRETQSEWRFAGGPIVARDRKLAGLTL